MCTTLIAAREIGGSTKKKSLEELLPDRRFCCPSTQAARVDGPINNLPVRLSVCRDAMQKRSRILVLHCVTRMRHVKIRFPNCCARNYGPLKRAKNDQNLKRVFLGL